MSMRRVLRANRAPTHRYSIRSPAVVSIAGKESKLTRLTRRRRKNARHIRTNQPKPRPKNKTIRTTHHAWTLVQTVVQVCCGTDKNAKIKSQTGQLYWYIKTRLGVPLRDCGV